MSTPKPTVIIPLKPIAGLGHRRKQWSTPLPPVTPDRFAVNAEPLPRPTMVGEGPERVAAIERVRDGYRNDPELYKEIYGGERFEGGRTEIYGGGY